VLIDLRAAACAWVCASLMAVFGCNMTFDSIQGLLSVGAISLFSWCVYAAVRA